MIEQCSDIRRLCVHGDYTAIAVYLSTASAEKRYFLAFICTSYHSCAVVHHKKATL